MGQLAVPALFLASHEDDTVRSEHSEALFNRCPHERKKLSYIRGLHNEARDDDCLREIRNFIEEVIA
jgi:alpha-beta hydrolase superfamily lysophospholipase